ncbi:sensor histidine kinase [Agarilytica rhodophyticola]|uniref:sensor histidine kinase n=1 Tax=Agarilytica rhodophyticola TaxID=1737490 RepID=UPI000B3456F0|nr:ATP-binding protein [Agarilytica rhodophyticola]
MISTLDYDKSLLKKLIALKCVTLVISVLIVVSVYFSFDMDLPYTSLVITLFAGFIVLFLWAARISFTFPVTELEIFLLLVSDIIILLFLIEHSGGNANPFTSSMLVPLALAAALLRKTYSLTVVILTVAIYAYWNFGGEESHMEHMDHSNFSLHLYGMWINFLISAFILFIFVTYAMDSVRNREAELQEAREKILRDEQLVAIATVAATTAHALGTPLSTMSILLENWEEDAQVDKSEATMFREQLSICKNHLSTIGSATKSVSSNQQITSTVEAFYVDLRDHFHILRPTDNLTFSLGEGCRSCEIKQNRFLLLAVANLIDNALESGCQKTCVEFELFEDKLAIIITDDGEGLSQQLRDKLGKRFISSSKNGWGLGVYLSNSTIERFGGQISMLDHAAGGTITTVEIPFHKPDNTPGNIA